MTVLQLYENLGKLIKEDKGNLKVQVGCKYDSNYGYTSSNKIRIDTREKYIEIKGIDSEKYYED